MKARSAFSQLLLGVTPLFVLAACGDDGVGPTGAGGFGGAGGGSSSSSGPSTVGSTSSTGNPTTTSSSSSSSSTSSSSSSDGGGTTTSDGGGGIGGTEDGGGGFGGAPDGGGGTGGTGGDPGTGGFGGFGGASSTSTASTASSTSTGVIIPVAGLDTCPGDPFTLAVGMSLQLEGTTDGAASDYISCFGATGGNDVVFAFTLEEAGSLKLTLVDSAGFNGNLVIRGDCASSTGEECVRASLYGDTKGLARHFTAGTYYVIVDALSGSGGDFTLSATFGAPECGDAIINPGEVCDVGVAVANDGCGNPGAGNECQTTPAAADTDQCPGETLAVPAGASSVRAESGYSTLGHADDARGSCFFGSGGVDRIFALAPAISGSLTVSVGRTDDDSNWICQVDNTSPECWDQFLYARTDCASTDLLDELDCSDDFGTTRGETITFDVIQGEPVYLFVDGFNGAPTSRGPFNLQFQLEP